VRSKAIIASLKPWFSSPSRLAAGTSVSLKVIAAVSEARIPILSSCLSTITVSSWGTRKAEMPRWPASRSVFAKTVYQSACPHIAVRGPSLRQPLRHVDYLVCNGAAALYPRGDGDGPVAH
jgi:hypothetical protein